MSSAINVHIENTVFSIQFEIVKGTYEGIVRGHLQLTIRIQFDYLLPFSL